MSAPPGGSLMAVYALQVMREETERQQTEVKRTRLIPRLLGRIRSHRRDVRPTPPRIPRQREPLD